MGWLFLLVVLVCVFPAFMIGAMAIGLGALYWLLPIAAAVAVAWMVRDAWNTHRAYRH
jgi:hypothetical protein